MLTGDEVRALGIVPVADASGPEATQPNGVDLSLDAAWRLRGPGALGRTAADRHLPEREPVSFAPDGWAHLPLGVYGIRFHEQVHIPTDCAGLAFPRSSLMRMGVHVPTAVWDAGYRGRGESLLLVHNPAGVRLQRGARIAQIVVFRLTDRVAPYAGRYQGENVPTPPESAPESNARPNP